MSPSILPSITKYSLLYLAEHRLGLKAIEGEVYAKDLGKFVEAGACGTAAIISPIGRIDDGEDSYIFHSETEVGPTVKRLYDELVGVSLLPGVSIGDNSIIGAGSVVTKDIPENVIAAGNPCQVIRPIRTEDQEWIKKDKLFISK